MKLFDKINKMFGDPNEKALKKITPIIQQINDLEKNTKKIKDSEFKIKTQELKKKLNQGQSLEQLLPEAFAYCREAARRVLGERAYDTQLIGAYALHQGQIAEMKTGEGKTLAAVHAVYLNALTGKGVHLITVNDYLAKRDTNWMGAVYHLLGLSVACIQSGGGAYLFTPEVESDQDEVSIEYENLKSVSKKQAYRADITYGTNNEFGFDYLRDNMVLDIKEMAQVRDVESLVKYEKRIAKLKKKQSKDQENQDQENLFKKDYLNFAIIDEVDSILIDEARTPLIISAPDQESAKLYQRFSKITPKLIADKDFNVDEKMQAVTMTDKGVEKVEKMLNLDNLYDPKNMRYVHHLHQALKAEVIFKRDKQYMVKDNQVLIVDEFTGRVMPGRRFSEGLHQALEAKEGVKIERESRTLANITFQNYFRLYKKLAGMTGTAMTSAEEFAKVYKLDILAIPTHKKMIRDDKSDKIYKTQAGKFNAITQDIKNRHQQGQPVLVGTTSVEKSESLAQYLDKTGMDYEILNAKNHEREAQIVANAGQKKAITISTNMAGRGTDIKLGAGVKELGGLHIIGTERHEARRIDNQLRGRAGRQGDPGSSQFYISLEDEIMRRFGSDRIKGLMDSLGLPEDQPIENRMISRSIESAQKKIEGFNFDIRKHVLEYDDVINRQREAIYARRRQNLLGLLEKKEVKRMLKLLIKNLVEFHTHSEEISAWNLKEIYEYSASLFNAEANFEKKLEKIRKDQNLEKREKRKTITETLINFALKVYDQKEQQVGAENLRKFERIVMLRTIDNLWMEHLDHMQFLREGVGLRGYGQRDPLIEYKREGFQMYQELLANIRLTTIESLFKATIQVKNRAYGANQANKESLNNGQGLSEKDQNREGNQMIEDAQITQTDKNERRQLLEQANENLKQKPTSKQANQPDLEQKIGRNQPCPCGSGKKYKKCCGSKV
ncbi:MAG: preprotein translocase subunit SecA [Candidatus Moranbacteria bacterium]|nr:preprotein translocase subunit SecA [Candidatus Moranbacteria bacterium]